MCKAASKVPCAHKALRPSMPLLSFLSTTCPSTCLAHLFGTHASHHTAFEIAAGLG